MQTALQVFRKDIREGTTHMLLKSAVLSALNGKGEVEKWFDDGRADVLADNTVFECLTNPNRSIIKEKIDKYTSKEMVFVVPETANKLLFARFECTVWFIQLKTGEVATKETFTASYIEEVEKAAGNNNEHGVWKQQNKVSYLFKVKNRDVEDMKKMSKIIGKAYNLKKLTISYVARFIMLKILKEAPDGNHRKVLDEILQKGMEYVNNKQPKSILKLPQYAWAPSVHTNQHMDVTALANCEGGKPN